MNTVTKITANKNNKTKHFSRTTNEQVNTMKLWKSSLLYTGLAAALGLMTSGNALAAGPDGKQRLIVKFKEQNFDARPAAQKNRDRSERIANRLGKSVKHMKRTALNSDVFVVEGASDADMQSMLAQVKRMSDVEYVEEDKLMQHYFTPNDTRYNEQWHYQAQGTSVNAPAAWDKATGNGVVVAVVDTGYRPHADLVGNLLPGYDMISDLGVANDGNGRDSDALDPGDATAANECGGGQPARSSSWHGTHVAGTVAAVTNNGQGIAGVAYNAKIVPVRVLGVCGGFTSDIADGIVWAAGGNVSGVPSNANPADVINLSLGGGGSCSQTYVNAINSARANGATVVVAAGNSNVNAANAVPANCPGVITVAATGPTGAKAGYSNFGSVVDVAAPGGDLAFGSTGGVLSTLNTGSDAPGSDNYAWYQGTSMAAPHVAGVAALLYEAKPNATPDEIEAAIKGSAQSFPGSCSQCGTGIADANAAIDRINGGDTGGGGVDPVSFTETGVSANRRQWVDFTITVPAGASTLDVSTFGGSGDADLYIRQGTFPELNNFDGRSWNSNNNESLSVTNPTAGTWYISVYAYRAFSGLTVTATAQ